MSINYHKTVVKDPDAVFPYTLDWEDMLPASASVTAVSVTADSGLTVASTSYTTTTTTAVLSGGTDGEDYNVRFRPTFTGSLTDDRTILVKVRNR